MKPRPPRSPMVDDRSGKSAGFLGGMGRRIETIANASLAVADDSGVRRELRRPVVTRVVSIGSPSCWGAGAPRPSSRRPSADQRDPIGGPRVTAGATPSHVRCCNTRKEPSDVEFETRILARSCFSFIADLARGALRHLLHDGLQRRRRRHAAAARCRIADARRIGDEVRRFVVERREHDGGSKCFHAR